MQARSTAKLGESSWVSSSLLSSGLSPPSAPTGGSAYSVSPGGISDASNTAQGGHPHAHAQAQHTLHGGFESQKTASNVPSSTNDTMSYDTTPGRTSMQSTRSSPDRRPHQLPSSADYPVSAASGLPTSSTTSHLASTISASDASNGTTQATSHAQQPITPSQSGFEQPPTPGSGVGGGAGGEMEVVPTSFDEATLRALCDMDVSIAAR